MTIESPQQADTDTAASEPLAVTEAPAIPKMPPQPPMPPSKNRPSPRVAGLLGLAAGAALVGGAWVISANIGPGDPDTFTLKGFFSLTDGSSVVRDGSGGCRGSGGYDDIQEGTSVTVYDASGSVVATGNLGHSKGAPYSACVFKVAVDGVPKGQKYYKVEVSHRGTVQMTAEEAEAGELAATLG
ncbi:hypothetical protein [Streptomyces aureus]|uniref:hypothetical protein n=1 Tax=Streptomyces aureus TaxID=193461 RepID=UPI0033C3D6BA